MTTHLQWLLIIATATPVFGQCPKRILDPAEYNAYISAASACSVRPFDVAQSAASWEEFLRLHPDSAQRQDALEVLLVSYYRAHATDKLVATANRMLGVNDKSLPALAVLAYAQQNGLNRGSNSAQTKNDSAYYAKRGRDAIPNVPQDKCAQDESRCIVPFATAVFDAANKDAAEESLSGMMSVLLQRHCNLRPQF